MIMNTQTYRDASKFKVIAHDANAELFAIQFENGSAKIVAADDDEAGVFHAIDLASYRVADGVDAAEYMLKKMRA